MTFYEPRGKRTLDVAGAALAGLLLLPVLVLTAVAIRVYDGGPSLFRQVRIGQDGREFTFFKFRSMPVDSPSVESAQAAELVVTRIGRLIRRTSIDELPQLFNIVRGDMSLVGPRPPVPAQRELIELRRSSGALRHRPGLTGLAQVEGYDGMPDAVKAGWDAEYARYISFRRDVHIVLRTISYLVRPPPTY